MSDARTAGGSVLEDPLEIRDSVVQYARAELLGPRGGEQELLDEEPHVRYVAGTLFPRAAALSAAASGDEEEETSGAGTEVDDQGDDPVGLANQSAPASLGLSFFLRGCPDVLVEIRGARYQEEQLEGASNASDQPGVSTRLATGVTSPTRGAAATDGNEQGDSADNNGMSAEDTGLDPQDEPATEPGNARKPRRRSLWRRHPFAVGDRDELVLRPPAHGRTARLPLPQLGASVVAIWRQGRDGWLTTVSLVNDRVTQRADHVAVQDCLYQVELECRPMEGGEINVYPRSRLLTEDEEEHELDLLYRRDAAYGVGHGCAVVWTPPIDGTTRAIRTESLPTATVPSISYDLPGHETVLRMGFLADGEQRGTELFAELDRFVDAYRDWILDLPKNHPDIPVDLERSRDKLLLRLNRALERMRGGIEHLRRDPEILHAFCLANQAMLMQRAHTRPDYAGERHAANSRPYTPPELEPPGRTPERWRPFQLAFQLLSLDSIVRPDAADREVVDLIWFPTGGGKTEAYLAVAAFTIFLRRLRFGADGGGTTVLMRYTLRLLTTQQFRRAATLICAAELLRQEDHVRLGPEPITIGLWVGRETTPNQYSAARDQLTRILDEDRPRNPFQIDRCPWCGTQLVPDHRSAERLLYGIIAEVDDFRFFCPTTTCPFADRLPIGVVDEQLYEHPPTLLLGTVDKFARLPWEGRAGDFFGGSTSRPPELIIQDELHLISGPLGTVVGIYETAIDLLASWDGRPPKILASTATIRRADAQCYGLYGRRVELFPPSGLEGSDSYFARYERSKPGRLYMGVLAPNHTASTTMIRTSAALLQAPIDLGLEGESLDAYWTLVAYHNSLRELGKSVTFGKDDIPARLKVIAERNLRSLTDENVQELTSNLRAWELADVLSRLELRADSDQEISLLLCTNMLSVGVDVSRLGLMLVNGQPKSTSEYIQATSRVGRSDVPGLIVCVYSPSKPRDRSHYERFTAYHAALYRYVEPTSVTPFAPPARVRALHAVLVILVRYRAGLANNTDAQRFRRSLPEVVQVKDWILERIGRIDPREAERAAIELETRMEEWEGRAQSEPTLQFQSMLRQHKVLLRSRGDEHTQGWETLQSMRNVDSSCVVKVLGPR